ncbi:triose-phosphate isomerase [Rhodobacterales bacterium HKCCE2091]|nr:triose-phosphate isomerase [Rhodobacterales bacterium HKCCE2091]
MRRKLAAGNWKMNGLTASLSEIGTLAGDLPETPCEVLICPPATLIAAMAGAVHGTGIAVGGQDCHAAESGAHTGDISAAMLADAGASHVILGHSERRADHGETDADVAAKTEAAWKAGLTAVVCVGETEAQYRAGETLAVIRSQLAGSLPGGTTAANTVIAYEPVWAIGTGLVPQMDEIASVHGAIRAALSDRFGADMADGTRILYGGSVKPGNAAEIFAVANVDGALVGGASLKAADFGPIVAAASAA